MQRSYERAWSKVNSLTARVEELLNENRMLRESLRDYGRVVKGVLGHDTVATIVQAERHENRRLRSRNGRRDGRWTEGGESEQK